MKGMKSVEAEKLLGGYAAGILNDEEKTALFEAALERQEIFDALMDEDVLRQILSDPESRAKVAAALEFSSTEPPAKIRPFWQKPLWMGVAASAFLVFMTSYAIKRSGIPLPPAGVGSAGPEQGAGQVPEQGPVPVKPADGPERMPAGYDASGNGNEEKAGTAKNAALAEQPDLRQSAKSVSAQNVNAPAAPVKKASNTEDVAQNVAPSIRRAALPVIGGGAAKTSETTASPVPERPSVAPAALSARAADAQLEMRVSLMSKDAVRPDVPNPIWTVTRLDNGRLSIKVVRTLSNAVIVLLLRSDSGVRAVAPIQQSSNDFQYEVNIASGDRIDLYQLRTAVPDYLKLPESGPVDGQRVRIYG